MSSPAAVTRVLPSPVTGLLGPLLVWGLLAAGCARPDVIHLHLPGVEPESADAAEPAALRVAVLPFEDRRGAASLVGRRTPFLGDPQELRLETADAGRLTADLMSQVLRGQGWRAEVARARTRPSEADVVLTGELLELAVDADGSFLHTTIQARSRVAIQALNTADGSTVRQTLTGVGTQDVFWFEPEDAEGLVQDILLDSFRKLVRNTRVEQARLRLK